MRAALLYLSLCWLVWAESELQPHHRKAKHKCAGEHQIMVKGRHANHGFYIFNYVYSSSVPNNQTQIEKEENKENVSSAPDGFDQKPRKPIDKFTDHTQETRQGRKVEKGKEVKPESRRTSESRQSLNEHRENPRNVDLRHYHLKVDVDKGRNEIATDDTTTDIDGSGDAGFPGQEGPRRGLIVDKRPHEQEKDQQITRGTITDRSGKKDKDGKSGISSSTKSSKYDYIKIGVKENDSSLSSVIQETNSDRFIPKKMKDLQSKDYSKVPLKGNAIPTNKESGRKEWSGHIDLQGREGSVSATLNSHLNGQSNHSRDIPGNAGHGSKSNYTSISGSGKIKIANKKGTHNATEHGKHDYEATMIIRKQNVEKEQSGVSKSHKDVEVRGDIFSSHVKINDKVKLYKKDETRGEILKGESKTHKEASGISKTPKKGDSNVGVTKKFISDLEDPVFTKPDKTNYSGIILDGFGIAQSHSKDDMALRGRISGNQISGSDVKQEGRKAVGRVGTTHQKSSAGKEAIGLAKPHRKEVDRKGHKSSLRDRETHEKGKTGSDVKAVKVHEDIIKVNTSYNKVPEDDANLRQRNTIYYSSDRKAERRSPKSIRVKSTPSFPHRSHNNVQHPLTSPKDDRPKIQEHSSTSVKRIKTVTKPDKKSAKTGSRTYGSKIAKQYHGHSSTLRRKSSQHDRMHSSLKRSHKSDSSQSSESWENSWQDSRRSYEDYQNDKVDSYQSAESLEEDLSLESNESDDRSQMEDRKSNSQEDSHEHKSSA
ncbi:uncharacterized protein LOC103278895 [Anolis carolinensis]|uniref:uncharacterized protein LOC103278895 n=1 Tax=Anolis carolinensis TaxID=28377 RepID=UPI0004629EE4|nr:PREDICTED: uncharacterized protein LOC103278895 [Anolis carolinensis]|eukprot:XP_008109231.1 PREDICTED: uncharacterized protein LOC103278895 [Anolis carolinensis]